MLSATFNESLKKELNILPELIMFFNLLLVLCVIGLECFLIIYPEGYVSEHIRAAFFVYNGEIPFDKYRYSIGKWDPEQKRFVKQIANEGIYLLKQEYRKDKCQYDSIKRQWNYVEE